MTYKEIQDLIKLISKTELSEFKLKKEEFEIVIRTQKHQKGESHFPISAPPVMSVPQHHVTPQAVHPSTPPEPSTTPSSEAGTDSGPATPELLEVKSPIVGTFYRAPSPDKPPFKKVGDMVEAGETVCIVEAMKLFNEIESEISGKIVKVVVEDASPVEYDQVLFLVEPNG